MTGQPSREPSNLLRALAELEAQVKPLTGTEGERGLSPGEIRFLLHELQVHQIELEMQNEELRRSQVRLDASQARYFELYDLAPVGYFTLSEPGIILEINLTASDLLGRPRSALVGQPLSRFVLPEDQDLLYVLRRNLVETRTLQSEKLRLLREDAGPFWVRLNVNAVREPAGATLLRGVFTDISEHMKAEEERKRLSERLTQFQKLEAIGVLAAGIAHNLNNVLAAILGYASLGEGTTASEQDREAFRIISKSCERGRDVTASLLHFARANTPTRAPFEVNTQVREIGELLHYGTQGNASVVERLAGEPLWVNGDAGNINQALMNLCVNAFDAMPRGGTLTLRTSAPEPDWILLEVEDTGEGMTPEIQARVLEPFFTTKPVGKGTGLGLSMCYGVVEAHGGTLDISSQPGRGTLVKVRLPRIPAPVQPVASPTRERDFGPLKVLMVDDEEFIRDAFTHLLEREGFQASSTGSGPEALERIAAGDIPDLIILDVNMPGMNGMETLARIRAILPEIPVLIASGRVDLEDLPCFQERHVAVLQKPYSLGDIREKLGQEGFLP